MQSHCVTCGKFGLGKVMSLSLAYPRLSAPHVGRTPLESFYNGLESLTEDAQ